MRGEQSCGALLAVFGLAAEAELAVDDRGAQGALGVVVGWLHTVVGSEDPRRGPRLQEVAGYTAGALVARPFGCVGADDRLVAPLQ